MLTITPHVATMPHMHHLCLGCLNAPATNKMYLRDQSAVTIIHAAILFWYIFFFNRTKLIASLYGQDYLLMHIDTIFAFMGM